MGLRRRLQQRTAKRVLRQGTYLYFDEVARQLNLARSVHERDGAPVTWLRLVQAHRRGVYWASKQVPEFWHHGDFHLTLLGAVLWALDVDGMRFDEYLVLRTQRADLLDFEERQLDSFDEDMEQLGQDGWLRRLADQSRPYFGEDASLHQYLSRYEDIVSNERFRDDYRRERRLARTEVEVPSKRRLKRALNRVNDRIRP